MAGVKERTKKFTYVSKKKAGESKIASAEICDIIEHADERAQQVVNNWCINVSAGNSACLTASFKALFETAEQYRTAKQTADSHREFNSMTEAIAAREKAARESFAKAYLAEKKAQRGV